MNENPNCDNNFMLGNEWDEFNFKDKEKKYLNENHGNPNQINEMDFFFDNYNNKNNANTSHFSNSASGKNGTQRKTNINGSSDTSFNKYLTDNINDPLWGESNESYNVGKSKKETSKTPIKKASQKSNKLISNMDENMIKNMSLREMIYHMKKKKKKKNQDDYIVHTGKGSINNSNIYKKSGNDIDVISKNNRNIVKENEKIKNSADYHKKNENSNTVIKSDSFYEGEFTPSLKSGNKLSSYDDINLNSEHDIKIEYCSDKSISQCKVVNSNSNKISIKKKNDILLNEDYEKNIYNKKKKNKDLVMNSNDNNSSMLSDSKHSVSSLQVNNKMVKKKSESVNSNNTSKYRYISSDNNNMDDGHTKGKVKISKKMASGQELVNSYKDCTKGVDEKSKEEVQLKSEIKKKKIMKSINNPNISQSFTSSMIDDSEHTYYDNTKFSEQSSSNLLKLDESSEFFCNSNTIGDENMNGKIKKIKMKKGIKEEKNTKKKNIENMDNNKKEIKINKSRTSKQAEQNYTLSSEENQTFESIKTNDSKFFDEIKEYLHNKNIKETANAEKKTDYNFNAFDDLNEDLKLKKKQTIRASSKNMIYSDKEKVRNSSSSGEKLSKVTKMKDRVKSVDIMNESELEIKSNEAKIKGEKSFEKKQSIKQKGDEGVKKINEAKMYNSNSTMNSNFSNSSNLKKKKSISDKTTVLDSIEENASKFYGEKEVYADRGVNNEGNKIGEKGSIKNGIHTDIATDEDDTTINYNDDENETVNSNSNSNKFFVKKKKDSSMDGNEMYGTDLGFEGVEEEVKKVDNKNEGIQNDVKNEGKNDEIQTESLIQKGRKFKNMFISFIKRESYKKDEEENEQVDENKIITKKEFIKWNEMNLNMYNENGSNDKTVSSLYGFGMNRKSVSIEFNDVSLNKLEESKKSASNENMKTFSNDTISENNSNGKKKANTIYNNFLESLKHPSCKIVVDKVKKFILNFPQNLSREEAANKIHTFINETQPILLKSSIYKNLNIDQINIIIQGYEKFIIQKLYFYLYRMDPEDKDQDEQIYTKINCLQWVELKHLEICESIDLDRLKLAQGELLKIQKMKAPYDKIIMILNCCRIVTSILFEAKKNDSFTSTSDTKQVGRDSQVINLMDSNNVKDELSTSSLGLDERNGSKNENRSDKKVEDSDDELLPCADEVLPLLIYVIIKTNPPELISNITFIQNFRHPNHFVSEEAYSFTQFCSGVEFVKELGKTTFLNISEKEYKENVSKAEEFYLNEVKESNKKLQETAGKLNDFIKHSNEKKLNNNIITKIESIKLKYENVENLNTITISDLSSLFEEYKVLVELKKSILKDLQDHA
ncbi:hypothetical protein YYE_04260 [Plasmodium vinckei vinckei]|uniref:VPS9 domain-containing protein n=1 Tax=Plasmodium vinckei vinckei TaxID=54757 RepID=A0A081IAV6_PLAVN|nr:hypothetical protein YYE_04260 [Plasmodium vinckei vinckei]